MKKILYCGTWDISGHGGLGIYGYNEETGAAVLKKLVTEDIVAGLMMVDSDRGMLYTVDERMDDRGPGAYDAGGSVFSFSIDKETGDLTEVNSQPSFGVNAAYLTGDGTGNGIVMCNHSSAVDVVRIVQDEQGRYKAKKEYGDTAIVHYPIMEDGSLGEADDILVTPPEDGVYSCMHCVNLAPDGKTLIACDRNLENVYKLHFDTAAKKIVVDDILNLKGTGVSGADKVGPRYAAFHPAKPLVYVNSEYVPELRVINYEDRLCLESVKDITLGGYEGKKASQSDLIVSSNGKILYMLYRHINAVGVFSLDEDGTPKEIQALQLTGRGPRGCTFSPDGRFLLIANLESADITACEILADGTLREGIRVETGQWRPGNLVFV